MIFSDNPEVTEHAFRQPQAAEIPSVPGAEIAAAYSGERMGGDFFDFVMVGGRLIFLMLDVSGARDRAQEIAAVVQETFRGQVPQLFGAADLNEATAVIELSLQLNRTVLETAGGICSSSAFIGCYNPALGTVCYSNAGHVPGLVRDHTGITQLPATGLPFGLFSHATHDAPMTVLEPGAALLLVSRGVIEGRWQGNEFGMEGVQATFQNTTAPNAQRICVAILDGVESFMCGPPTHNDVTALTLLRFSENSTK